MKRRARRAPSADSLLWTPEDRKAIQQSRINNQSRHYHADVRALSNGETLKTIETKK